MRRANIASGVLAALVVAGGGCRTGEEAKPGTDPAARPSPALPVAPASGPDGPARIRPMKKVPILVGGCGADCARAESAVARFLDALSGESDPDRAERFLDTTAFEVDGRPLGTEWARMWREMRAATRKDSIRETVRDLATWKAGLTREQVRAALAEGPRPVRAWTTEAVYDWAFPGGSWRITLRPRGIEWLVTRVERRVGDEP